MRQHLFLRWIEQAEARKFADTVSYEYAVMRGTERERNYLENAVAPRHNRRRRLWHRLRPFRVADNFC